MGTIISGKIESGKLKKGQNVIVMPNKVKFWRNINVYIFVLNYFKLYIKLYKFIIFFIL